jgi:hypothetical protein
VDASYYIVTITGIKRAAIVKTRGANGEKRVSDNVKVSINASNCVITSKSISDASIKYFLHPRCGDNIILLSKR